MSCTISVSLVPAIIEVHEHNHQTYTPRRTIVAQTVRLWAAQSCSKDLDSALDWDLKTSNRSYGDPFKE